MAVTGLLPAGAPWAHRPAALGPTGPRRWAGACNLSPQLLCPPVSVHTRDRASLTGPATVTYGVGGVGPEEKPAPGEAGRCCGPLRPEAGPLRQKHPGQVVSCLWTLSDKPAVNMSVATHNIMEENWDQDETGGDPQRGGGVGRDRGSFGAKPQTPERLGEARSLLRLSSGTGGGRGEPTQVRKESCWAELCPPRPSARFCGRLRLQPSVAAAGLPPTRPTAATSHAGIPAEPASFHEGVGKRVGRCRSPQQVSHGL